MLVVFAIGLPNRSRLRSPYTLGGAARQIAAALQATRQRAIARNVRYRINFDTAHASYTIEREQAGNWVSDSAPQPLPTRAQLGNVTPNNTIFETRGMLAAQGSVPVTVTGSGTR